MKHRVTQFLFALGLLLTLAAGTLWVRGRWTSDHFAVGQQRIDHRVDRRDQIHLFSGSGLVRLEWGWRTYAFRDPLRPPIRPSRFYAEHTALPVAPFAPFMNDDPNATVLGRFDAWGGFGSRGDRFTRSFRAPWWFVMLGCASLAGAPSWVLWHHHRRRRRRRRSRERSGWCVLCGYDLRGAEHECCPECGETVDHPPGARVGARSHRGGPER